LGVCRRSAGLLLYSSKQPQPKQQQQSDQQHQQRQQDQTPRPTRPTTPPRPPWLQRPPPKKKEVEEIEEVEEVEVEEVEEVEEEERKRRRRRTATTTNKTNRIPQGKHRKTYEIHAFLAPAIKGGVLTSFEFCKQLSQDSGLLFIQAELKMILFHEQPFCGKLVQAAALLEGLHGLAMGMACGGGWLGGLVVICCDPEGFRIATCCVSLRGRQEVGQGTSRQTNTIFEIRRMPKHFVGLSFSNKNATTNSTNSQIYSNYVLDLSRF
jgi:hypothetical protein